MLYALTFVFYPLPMPTAPDGGDSITSSRQLTEGGHPQTPGTLWLEYRGELPHGHPRNAKGHHWLEDKVPAAELRHSSDYIRNQRGRTGVCADNIHPGETNIECSIIAKAKKSNEIARETQKHMIKQIKRK
ncbi:uncharacterized protein [Branchiostoma lanceolatum]|uniref:uncharacterized protein n=1 Tax=Branchiostoma lanceolatum TaxID=7740 RepID=UPI00345194AD